MPAPTRRRHLVAALLLVGTLVPGCSSDEDAPAADRRTPDKARLSADERAGSQPPQPSEPSGTPGRGGRGKRSHRQQRPTCAELVGDWPLRRLAAQTLVVPVPETQVGRVAPQVAQGVGGVILFGSRAPADLRRDLQRLRAHAPRGTTPLVMTDEEGGAVQRMANVVGDLPAARTMGRTMTPDRVRRLAHRAGTRMAAAGVDVDLAPVLDLDDRPGPNARNSDGTRSFSIRPRVATSHGLAFADGLSAAGVTPVVKHFPGLGRATANSDVRSAATLPWRRLREQGLEPFAAAVRRGVPAVMVSTAHVPGLTPQPAALSRRAVHGVLRGDLGFRGLVVADSLSSGAVRDAGHDVPGAAVLSLRAGVDLLLFSAPPAEVGGITGRTIDRVVHAVRTHRLPRARLEQAAAHVLAVGADAPCR